MLHEHLGGGLPVVTLKYHYAVLDGPARGKGALHFGAELVHVLVAHLQPLDDRRWLSKASHLHAYLYASFLTIQFGEDVLESFV